MDIGKLTVTIITERLTGWRKAWALVKGLPLFVRRTIEMRQRGLPWRWALVGAYTLAITRIVIG